MVMMMVMVTLMMLVHLVTMLRYVEKNIVVPSRAASPKPSSRSRIVTWSLSDFMSLETYPRDHTCSGTPQYPRRYMKSIQLGNTPHDPFKLYNLFFFAHVSSF